MIDKQSPLPIYYQIIEDLQKRIEKSEFKPGELIPSERELSEYYDVSRMTVRQAITNMVNDRELYRERGKGTFVGEPKIEQPLQGMRSFTEDMNQRGMTASSRLLFFETVPASQEVAQKLGVQEGDQVYHLKRIRYADQKPMTVEVTFIPVSLVPDLTEDVALQSLYHYVETSLGKKIEKATQVIEATIADDSLAELLEVPAASAILQMERTGILEDGRPFETVTSSFRADRYKLISDIYRV